MSAEVTTGRRGGKRARLVAMAVEAAKKGGRVLYVTPKGTALLTPVIEEDGSAGVRVQVREEPSHGR